MIRAAVQQGCKLCVAGEAACAGHGGGGHLGAPKQLRDVLRRLWLRVVGHVGSVRRGGLLLGHLHLLGLLQRHWVGTHALDDRRCGLRLELLLELLLLRLLLLRLLRMATPAGGGLAGRRDAVHRDDLHELLEGDAPLHVKRGDKRARGVRIQFDVMLGREQAEQRAVVAQRTEPSRGADWAAALCAWCAARSDSKTLRSLASMAATAWRLAASSVPGMPPAGGGDAMPMSRA